MSEPPIPYGRQSIDDDDIRAVVECLRGDWLTQGPAVERFEGALCEATEARHAVAVSSGTAALHIAYLAMGLGPGDLALAAGVSFVATANGARYTGADVGFADIDPGTGLVNERTLLEALADLGGRTPKVVAPVDLTGRPCDRAAVLRVADACGARVLEDAAHSLGGSYVVDGRAHRVGSCSHADAAILSFHPVKHVTTAEGGAITTNDAALAGRMREIRTHGIHKEAVRFTRGVDDPWVGPWYYEQDQLGFNYRITDLQCALGASQMRKLDRFVARRREIAARYDEALSHADLAEFVAPLGAGPRDQHAYHLYVVQLRRRSGETLDRLAARRKALYSAMRDRGVLCQVHYVPIPWQPYYLANPPACGAQLTGAGEYYAASLSIPMFPGMTDAMVDRVVHTLRDACADADRR